MLNIPYTFVKTVIHKPFFVTMSFLIVISCTLFYVTSEYIKNFFIYNGYVISV